LWTSHDAPRGKAVAAGFSAATAEQTQESGSARRATACCCCCDDEDADARRRCATARLLPAAKPARRADSGGACGACCFASHWPAAGAGRALTRAGAPASMLAGSAPVRRRACLERALRRGADDDAGNFVPIVARIRTAPRPSAMGRRRAAVAAPAALLALLACLACVARGAFVVETGTLSVESPAVLNTPISVANFGKSIYGGQLRCVRVTWRGEDCVRHGASSGGMSLRRDRVATLAVDTCTRCRVPCAAAAKWCTSAGRRAASAARRSRCVRACGTVGRALQAPQRLVRR
jgi:hypothetical protein